jgi:7-cyano-7-deazaguanine synthase
VIGNSGFGPLPELSEMAVPSDYVIAPFIHSTKANIAYTGIELGVPFEDTWSCYKGADRHCGKCGTCVERLEAIDTATREYREDLRLHPDFVWDHTRYDNKTYWKEALSANSS